MSETATLRRYSPEEDNLILHLWYDKNRRQELAEKLDRPLGGLAYRFYQLLKERNMGPKEYRRLMRQGKGHLVLAEEPKELSTLAKIVESEPELEQDAGSQANNSPDDLLEALKYFPAKAQAIELELAKLKKDIAQLKAGRTMDWPDFFHNFNKVQEYKEENIQLKERVQELEAEREALKSSLGAERQKLEQERKSLKDVYDDLEATLSEFMRMSSVDKIRVLGDFASRLEVTVDRFGNVVKVKRSL